MKVYQIMEEGSYLLKPSHWKIKTRNFFINLCSMPSFAIKHVDPTKSISEVKVFTTSK